MSETQDYEWYETPYGKFRIEQKRFGTWSSYGENGEGYITGLTREVVVGGTAFYLEGKATNWANYQSSETYDGTVGGKL
jgi:hypothetical protein